MLDADGGGRFRIAPAAEFDGRQVVLADASPDGAADEDAGDYPSPSRNTTAPRFGSSHRSALTTASAR